MSTTTTNLNLTKPSGSERPLVSVINSNMDKIDAAIGEVDATEDGSLQEQINTIQESVPLTNTVSGVYYWRYGRTVTVCLNAYKTPALAQWTNGATIVTLPEGSRPPIDIIAPCTQNGGSANFWLYVYHTGEVKLGARSAAIAADTSCFGVISFAVV